MREVMYSSSKGEGLQGSLGDHHMALRGLAQGHSRQALLARRRSSHWHYCGIYQRLHSIALL